MLSGYRGGNVNAPLGMYWPLWLGAFGCFFLGLLEDLRNGSLSPRSRLLSKSLLLLVVFLLLPSLVPYSVGIPGIAGYNIALQSAFYGASLFLIFNVISGRLFLGDAGSYGIGAAMLLSGLVVLSHDFVSLSFPAALYFYPCVDFSVSLLRRWRSGASLTAPDNDHLHNRVNTFFKGIFRSKNMANSATGLSIALGSSGLVLLIYLADYIPLTSNLWPWVFTLQSALYGLIFMGIGKPK